MLSSLAPLGPWYVVGASPWRGVSHSSTLPDGQMMCSAKISDKIKP
jgi:hypothetical protein